MPSRASRTRSFLPNLSLSSSSFPSICYTRLHKPSGSVLLASSLAVVTHWTRPWAHSHSSEVKATVPQSKPLRTLKLQRRAHILCLSSVGLMDALMTWIKCQHWKAVESFRHSLIVSAHYSTCLVHRRCRLLCKFSGLGLTHLKQQMVAGFSPGLKLRKSLVIYTLQWDGWLQLTPQACRAAAA